MFSVTNKIFHAKHKQEGSLHWTFSFLLALSQLTEECWYSVQNPLFLLRLYHEFNKNDYKITVCPMSFYGVTYVVVQWFLGASNMHEIIRRALSLAFMSLSFVWSFTISNQIAGIEEDRKNKSWRPLPKKLCSVAFATLLLILSTVCYLIHGLIEDVFWYCAVWVVTFIIHNHLKGDVLWWSKNLCNAIGAFCMQSSCCQMMTGRVDVFSTLVFAVTSAYFWCVIDMQDYRDLEGDQIIGRETFPMIFQDMTAARKAFFAKALVSSMFYAIAMFAVLLYCKQENVHSEISSMQWIVFVAYVVIGIVWICKGSLELLKNTDKNQDDRTYKKCIPVWYLFQLLLFPVVHGVLYPTVMDQ
ncbi:hypothetical protein C9374_001912 [Naegleria lovaniensis]|uniref:Uncharacterized protein n=1 Tax=Naegleria lovaniensis TaxID=51637 RepID=A0AA88KQY5_NAELO|nr:uncharacterized protein C9374_001912 [Naegleria lovaniensis]KAG2386877.1 hypothetical protein C9374_001912 [Naegleria lovaniensis]